MGDDREHLIDLTRHISFDELRSSGPNSSVVVTFDHRDLDRLRTQAQWTGQTVTELARQWLLERLCAEEMREPDDTSVGAALDHLVVAVEDLRVRIERDHQSDPVASPDTY